MSFCLPCGKQKLIDASSAHQIFGRAGRPQFDDRGFVFAIAHEDDVRILRWKEQYDRIPEDTRDPVLLKKKKDLKRKKPSRRDGVQYWSEGVFDKLKAAPAGKLYSKGPLPWRLLAYLLKLSPEVERVRRVIRKRLIDQPRIVAQEKALERMLLTLHSGGFVTLDPAPQEDRGQETEDRAAENLSSVPSPLSSVLATPTPKLDTLLAFRSIHPLYAAFLLDHLGIADREERLQAFESVLELPRPVLKYVRVPWPDDLPPGPLATTRLDAELIQRGLIAAPLPVTVDEETAARAWADTLNLARAHDLTAYDAAYLEPALRLGLPLATLDDKLKAACAAAGVPVFKP